MDLRRLLLWVDVFLYPLARGIAASDPGELEFKAEDRKLDAQQRA